MFKPIEKTELNHISLTGMRSLVLIGLLTEAPLSLEEIRQVFLDLNLIEESSSLDTIRIDIKTIKNAGCKLSRPTPSNGHKYELLEHPFALKLTEDDIKYFKKVYNKIKAYAEIKALIEYDELINKIAKHIYDEDIKNKFIGISAFKYFPKNFIKDLIIDCKNEHTLQLIYTKPPHYKEYEKEVIAQKLIFNNDQVYLHCYDKSIQKTLVLNVKRIIKILSRKTKGGTPDIKTTTVKFHLKDFDIDSLTENEIIVEHIDNDCIVEGNYYNKFLAIQRILSFGSKCTVLEPLDFRAEIITKLKKMRDVYGS